MQDPLHARLVQLGGELQRAYRALLERAVGPAGGYGGLRPGELIRALGLDKSLAGRVVKAVRAADPLEALHALPTPQGLALVLTGAEARLAQEGLADGDPAHALLAAAGRAREAFAALLAEFPGGRGDLEAALTGWLTEEREVAEREARRDVFRGMSVLAGVRSAAFYSGYFLAPSATSPGRIDTAWVLRHERLRRLSVGSPFVFGGYMARPTEGGERARRETLDGHVLAREPARLLLPELCSAPLHSLDVLEGPHRVALRLGKDEPRVNEPITLTLGAATVDHHPLFAGSDASHVWFTTGVRAPTERLVIDLYVHAAIGVGAVPLATRGSDYVTELRPDSHPSELAPDAFSPRLTFSALGSAAQPDAREAAYGAGAALGAPELAAAVAARRGFDLAQFRLYRLVEDYPLPTDQTTCWVELAPR